MFQWSTSVLLGTALKFSIKSGITTFTWRCIWRFRILNVSTAAGSLLRSATITSTWESIELQVWKTGRSSSVLCVLRSLPNPITSRYELFRILLLESLYPYFSDFLAMLNFGLEILSIQFKSALALSKCSY